MTVRELHPTSFRFTQEELDLIDELRGAIAGELGGRFPMSRKTAVLVAVDVAIDHYVNYKARSTRNPA